MINTDKDTIQEWFLVFGDQLSLINKKIWFALLFVVIFSIPVYFVLTNFLATAAIHSYQPPEVTPSNIVKEPLKILDSGIFTLTGNMYAGYVKIQNTNYGFGVESQSYSAEFKTNGGTLITKVEGSTYILPSSEKLIVFSKFSAQQKPDVINFQLGESRFVHPPKGEFTYSKERLSLSNPADGMTISGAIKNQTPFTISRIDLPVIVYNNQNKIVAVNFTYIQDVKPNETRSFGYPPWPTGVGGAIRPEISPQINLFDSNIFQVSSATVDNGSQ